MVGSTCLIDHACVWWLYKVHLLFSFDMLLASAFHRVPSEERRCPPGCELLLGLLCCAAFFFDVLQLAWIKFEKLRWSCRRSELQGLSGTSRSLRDLSWPVKIGAHVHIAHWNAHCILSYMKWNVQIMHWLHLCHQGRACFYETETRKGPSFSGPSAKLRRS